MNGAPPATSFPVGKLAGKICRGQSATTQVRGEKSQAVVMERE